jgi:copper(I)-binding protein
MKIRNALGGVSGYLIAAWMMLTPALADIMVSGAQIKLGIGARPAAMHGVIMNHGEADTALIGAQSPQFERIELHTHDTDANGMMRMRRVDAYKLPANGMARLAPGGDHLMLFGFSGAAGTAAEVTLIFASGARHTIRVPTKMRDKHNGHKGQQGHKNHMGH